VPAAAIARTSTAMNIIRQGGASIGTAILSVILTAEITAQLGHHGGGAGLETIRQLGPAQQEAIKGPLASAFASTFVWAVVLLGIAFIPALAMALGKWETAESGGESASPERSNVVLE
jgi:hypothetical protein